MIRRRPLFGAALFVAAAAAAAAPAQAPAGGAPSAAPAPAPALEESLSAADLARLGRAARSEKLPDLKALAGEIAGLPSPAPLLPIAIEALFSAEKGLARAVDERDREGAKLYSYYLRNYESDGRKGSFDTPKEQARYDQMKAESRVLNARVKEARATLAALSAAVRTLADRASRIEPDRAPAAAAIRDGIERQRAAPAAIAAVLSSIPESLVPELAPVLFGLVTVDGDRGVRIAAIRSGLEAVQDRAVPPLSIALAAGDPFVRRAAARVLAELATGPAVGLLVERLPEESGLPADEILSHLRSLSGESFGRNPAFWQAWWKEMEPVWVGPFARDRKRAREAAEERWKYFGLSLASNQVVFVIDTSASMERGVGFIPPDRSTINAGRVKIDVAKEELKSAIDGLEADAWFTIIAYDTKTRTLSPKLLQASGANKKSAKAWVGKLEPNANTNPSSALADAFALTRPAGKPGDGAVADTIVLLSDGDPTCGPIKYADEIADEVARLNADGLVLLHTIHLGHEDTTGFMERLAEENGGKFVHVK